MKQLPLRSFALAGLLASTMAGSLLLGACNSQPTATEADKTATVVDSETTAASDSAAVTAPAADTSTTP